MLQSQLRIGAYELAKLLGEGGMGEVWLAQDTLADRPVALKFIKPHLLADPGFRTRFSNEAKTLGKLEHDRIVSLYSVLDEGEHLALVLRFIDGKSLADKIDSEGALPMSFVLACSRDILLALGFAHEHGIIHRDIKPPNILLDGRSRCFLMDFGIAVAEFADRGTVTGFAVGTPHYMSPEQIRTPREISIQAGGHRSDIYSFGIVLYEMLSGRVPFGQGSGAEDIYAIQHAHCSEPPPPLSEVNSEVPRSIEEVVMACLEKDPANRPQSCAQVLEELEAATVRDAGPARARQATVVEPRKYAAAAEVKPVVPVMPAVVLPSRKKVPQMAWYGLGAVVIAGGVGLTVIDSGSHTTVTPPPQTQTTQAPQADTSKPIPKTRKPDPGRIVVVPTPPPPEPKPSDNERLAAREFLAGKNLYDSGDYCNSKAKLDEAVQLNPKPEYVGLQRSAANGCNSQ